LLAGHGSHPHHHNDTLGRVGNRVQK